MRASPDASRAAESETGVGRRFTYGSNVKVGSAEVEQYDIPASEQRRSPLDGEQSNVASAGARAAWTGGRGPRSLLRPTRPPNSNAGRATTPIAVAKQHPLIVILPALLLLAVGVALGVVRQPNFTATGQASVQIASSEPSALGGISEATPTTAAGLSRAVASNAVVNPVATAVNLNPRAVLAAISATPVPQSGDISFTATSRSANLAVRLVNAVTAALSRYVSTQANVSSNAPLVLAQYQAALAKLSQVQSDPNAVQAAKLRVGTLKAEYQQDILAPTTRLVVFSTATTASSDRKPIVELFGILGLVAGLAAGCALCALQARRMNPAMY